MTSYDGAIQASRVWKRFRQTQQPTLLKDRLGRRGDASRDRRSYRWALRDVDFRVQPGEAIGLIGSNGSGKSTLLKVLTRVMYPYAGSVQLKGRVGALIEVRAGIHPELTGRENVYLYGSLLGLSRQQVARRFDAIVDFAELGVAIDRQVKHYSTGMQMRLGFAVAAYLEPDILLVDEVLAVGDAAFQQRCLDRMRAVLQNGTTLVLVSHDLAALEAMCSRGLWLEQGTLRADGPIRSVLGSYRQAIEARSEEGALTAGPVRVIAASATGPEGSSPASSRPLSLTFELGADEPWNGRFFIGLTEGSATPVFVASHYLYIDAGRTRVVCELANLPVPGGRYAIWVSYESRSDAELIAWHHALSVVVSGPELDLAPLAVVRLSPVLVPSQWTSEPG